MYFTVVVLYYSLCHWISYYSKSPGKQGSKQVIIIVKGIIKEYHGYYNKIMEVS